ncbi:MAG: hypothetical protein GC189_00570 [Alphaproteobacteria bacterium]|nr:hypothetical protein [Alphaproteobacteria bacterium]
MGLGACAAGEPETLGGPVGVAGDDVAPAPVTPNPATADEDSCGMAAFASLIGEPAAEIDRNALPPRSRVITPEMMVTQDYAPRRLNIHVSSEGRVSSLRCG